MPSDLPTASAPGVSGVQRKVLFSAMKNEAPFVLEWIAYHKVIGFDEIVICSNPSNDGMEEVLAALAASGEIRHLQVTVPAGRSPQILASRKFTSDIGYRDGDWYIFLDADEFLNVHVGDRTVSALTDAMQGRQFALINWRVFGSGHQQRFAGRFIGPGFVSASTADFVANLEHKTLFRHSASVRSFGQQCLTRPLLANPSHLTVDSVVVGTGNSADPASRKHRVWLSGADVRGAARVFPNEFGWALAQVNHYIVRTPEFFALKRNRGRGYKPNAVGAANLRHTAEFYAAHDRNETEDRTILHWEAQVTREIARLRKIPAVAGAVGRSEGLVQAILADADAVAAPMAVGKPAATVAVTVPATPVAAPAAPGFVMTFPRKEAALVQEMYAKASVILEYGSGGSTLLAAKLGKTIRSVESDKAWADALSARLAAAGDSAVVHHVAIGPTEKWGFPTRRRFHSSYHHYALSVWDRPDLGTPDLVLIDGRFRAACLAAVRMRATRPTTVLFDDYEDRPYYTGVEKLVHKEATVGRMAHFTVTPGPIPPEMLTEVIGWFTDPR